MRSEVVGAGLFLAGCICGAIGARLLGPEPRATVGGNVTAPAGPPRPGRGDKPSVARFPVPGGSIMFVEGQEGLVFVPEVPK